MFLRIPIPTPSRRFNLNSPYGDTYVRSLILTMITNNCGWPAFNMFQSQLPYGDRYVGKVILTLFVGIYLGLHGQKFQSQLP
jgi:hypothetical protein